MFLNSKIMCYNNYNNDYNNRVYYLQVNSILFIYTTLNISLYHDEDIN